MSKKIDTAITELNKLLELKPEDGVGRDMYNIINEQKKIKKAIAVLSNSGSSEETISKADVLKIVKDLHDFCRPDVLDDAVKQIEALTTA
ncbi:MAG: hypothetical protein E7231_01620 [Cellulosilyticum sp.]|nr:hypothetical protein [Cellulosilyticum sp.]